MSKKRTYLGEISHAMRTVLKGMRVSGKHYRTGYQRAEPLGIESPDYFKKNQGPITIEYPMQKVPIPDVGRYRLHMETDDCIGCDKCARICPVDCITIETFRADGDLGQTSDGTTKRLHLPTFDIDMGKCMYCGLCTTVCPTDCLIMTKVYDYSEYDRDNFVYHFGAYSPKVEEEVRAATLVSLAKTKAAKAAKAAAAADSGDAPARKRPVRRRPVVAKPKVEQSEGDSPEEETKSEEAAKPVRKRPVMRRKPIMKKTEEDSDRKAAEKEEGAGQVGDSKEEKASTPAEKKPRRRPIMKRKPAEQEEKTANEGSVDNDKPVESADEKPEKELKATHTPPPGKKIRRRPIMKKKPIETDEKESGFQNDHGEIKDDEKKGDVDE